MRIRSHTLNLLGLTVALMGLTATANAEPRPMWQSLPPETVLAVQVPDAAATLEHLRHRTQLGVLLEPQRMEGLLEMLEEAGDLDLEEPMSLLERFDLERRDVVRFMNGPVGYALVQERFEDRPDVDISLFWATPGEAMAGKLYRMIRTGIEDAHADMPEQMREQRRRIDREVRGVDVVHLMHSLEGRDVPEDFWDWPDDFWQWDDEAQQAFHDQRHEAYEALPVVKVQQQNTMLARIDDAVIVVHCQSPRGSGDGDDWDRRSGVDRAEALIAHLIDVRKGEDGPRDFVSSASAAPGVREAMPAGNVVVDLLVDVGRLIASAREAEEDVADDRDMMRYGPSPDQVIEALGVDQVNIGAARIALDDNLLRMGVWMGVPAPRRGLMRLFEQPAVAPQPAGWVPETVPGYTHFSVDPTAFLESIKELAAALMGEEAAFFIPVMEQQMEQHLGVGPGDLTAAMGATHHLLQWPGPQDEEGGRFFAGLGDAGTMEPWDMHMAVVWPLRDEQVFERLFDAIAQHGDTEVVREQGFAGLRFEEEMSLGLLAGHGHLLAAFGDEAINDTMAILRRHGTGAKVAALRDSELQRRAARVLRLEPGQMYSVYDMNQFMPDGRGELRAILEAAMGMNRRSAFDEHWIVDDDDEHREWVERMRREEEQRREEIEVKLERIMSRMPQHAALENLFGVAVSQVVVDRRGVRYDTVYELAPPR